jgi:catechol 2,3-dioxygenase-like lactoylglutathione lyase family enzyme
MTEAISRPPLEGIHHLKLVVSDLDRSLAFYERVFGAVPIPEIELRDRANEINGHLLDVPGFGTRLEIRQHFAQALQQRAFDPISLAVADRAALKDWSAYLDQLGVQHSPILPGIFAWVLVMDDPDENRIRIYTRETHGSELQPDRSSSWIQS